MNPLATRRAKAYAIDMAVYAGVAAAMLPVGFLLSRAGIGESQTAVIAVSAVPPAIATAIATRSEAKGATIGKRMVGLKVEDADGAAVPVGRALIRNALKIAVPWQAGHIVTISTVYGRWDDPDAWLIAATVVCYGMIGLGLWGIARRSGLTVHDIVGQSQVVSAHQ